MPDEVADNELMRECWEWTVSSASHFSEQHIPQLVALAYWWAVARQCMANLASATGGVVTKVDTPMGPRQDPDVRTMQGLLAYCAAPAPYPSFEGETQKKPKERKKM
jgi:hypothetical protein